MKKSLLITLGLLLSLSSFSYAAPQVIETYLQNDFLIKVDGEFKYHPEGLRPLVYENRTYLPAAYIAELLGASTTFDSSTKTVIISSKPQVNLDEEKIAEYEKRIIELEDKIKKLESSTSVSSNYSKMPARLSKNGYKITLEGLSIRDDGRDGRLYFTLENEDINTGVKLNALSTTIEANGKKYNADVKYRENLDMDLFKWIKTDDEINSFIPFSDLPEEDSDIKEMIVTIVIETNELYPKQETIVFKVLND
jgi:hypothetical protein